MPSSAQKCSGETCDLCLCSISIYCSVICGWARLGGLWMEFVELLGPDLLATLWVPRAGHAWFASPVAEPFIACGYDAVWPALCDATPSHTYLLHDSAQCLAWLLEECSTSIWAPCL